MGDIQTMNAAKIKKSITIIFMILLVVTASSCDIPAMCEESEMIRKTSPDQQVDVVIVRINCGATASFSYKIFVVPTGDEAVGTQVFLSDKTDGLEVTWLANKKLQIKYERARIFEFTNFWHSTKVNNSVYDVAITESKK